MLLASLTACTRGDLPRHGSVRSASRYRSFVKGRPLKENSYQDEAYTLSASCIQRPYSGRSSDDRERLSRVSGSRRLEERSVTAFFLWRTAAEYVSRDNVVEGGRDAGARNCPSL